MSTRTEQSELYNLYSDLYKDRYYVRPRFAGQWSAARLQAAIDRLPSLAELDAIENPTSGEGWTLTAAA